MYSRCKYLDLTLMEYHNWKIFFSSEKNSNFFPFGSDKKKNRLKSFTVLTL